MRQHASNRRGTQRAVSQLPNGDFNHSSIITVLSPKGEILAHSSVLGKADSACSKLS
jgi:cytochrome oxidase Cu insertion factor (SCO1/SenC/PrrC family)